MQTSNPGIMTRLERAALAGDPHAEWTLDCIARHCRPGDSFRVNLTRHGVLRFLLRPSGARASRCVARLYLAH